MQKSNASATAVAAEMKIVPGEPIAHLQPGQPALVFDPEY
jgi:hypothetical protein